MLLIALRSFFFVGIVIGYSAGVWRLINDYFRREMKTFIDEEAKKNKYVLEDPVVGEVPPAVVGTHNPDQPPKPVTANQMFDELILSFGRLFTTRNEQELPSKKPETHQTSPQSIPNQFSGKVGLSSVAGGAKPQESMPQGQQIEFTPPPAPPEPPDGGAKTIIESDEFPRSSSTMITTATGGGVWEDDEEEWVRYWQNRHQAGVGGVDDDEQCQGSVIDSCELNLEPGS
uniref:Putative conserved secreted protein n=1 Tax=Culex tarsalis TaxID=7177 RepID=A0A1Q3FSK1_CULTA